MKTPEYDRMSKAELAAALREGLSKAQLRQLVAWYLESRPEGDGPAGGDAGSAAASNRWQI